MKRRVSLVPSTAHTEAPYRSFVKKLRKFGIQLVCLRSRRALEGSSHGSADGFHQAFGQDRDEGVEVVAVDVGVGIQN